MWLKSIRHHITLIYLIDGIIFAFLAGALTTLIWLNINDLSGTIGKNLQKSNVDIQQTQVYFAQQKLLSEHINAQRNLFDSFKTELDHLVLKQKFPASRHNRFKSAALH